MSTRAAAHAPRAAPAGSAIVDFSSRAPDLLARLRRQTGLEVTARPNPRHRFLLDYRDGRLCLVDTTAPRRPFHVDLERDRRGTGGADLLRRAMGRAAHSVIDATAGFGADAVHLGRAGFQVTAVERCAVIAALLEDALARLADASLRAAVRLVHGDAADVMGRLKADVVYLDPMYDVPGRIKSRPRRSMTLARELAGADADAPALLSRARACYGRVVVKRPDKSPPLADGVHHAHRGRTVRYDVYIDPDRAVR